MTEAKVIALIEKVYDEVLQMRQELDEIKAVLIQEEEPLEDEVEAYLQGKVDMVAEDPTPWKSVKKELGLD